MALAMFSAMLGHAGHIWTNGWLNYPNTNLVSSVFWDALTFLDLAAAVLLMTKPKLGLNVVLAIMLVDVMHNNIVHFEILYSKNWTLGEWLNEFWMIWGQILFLVFVLVVYRPINRALKKADQQV